MRFVISCRHDHADLSTCRNAYFPGDFWNWMLTVESVRYVLRAVICQKRCFSPSTWSRIKLFENRVVFADAMFEILRRQHNFRFTQNKQKAKKAELVNYNYYSKFNCKTIHPKKVLKIQLNPTEECKFNLEEQLFTFHPSQEHFYLTTVRIFTYSWFF